VTPESPFDPRMGLEARKTKRAKAAAKEVAKPQQKTLVYDSVIEALQAELAELRSFKDAAVARYPDLAVPEIVLRARQIAAAEYASDKVAVSAILNGTRDKSPLIRAILAALGGAS
jgi:hypothetical protein